MTVTTTWVSLRKPSAKRRAQRPVDQAAGEDGGVGGTALPAEEAAGDAPGGVHPLLDVDGEGEEVDALAHALGGVGGDQGFGAGRSWRPRRPGDWKASLPVSNERVLSVPLMGPETMMASAMCCLLRRPGTPPAGSEAAGPVPSWRPPSACRGASAPGDRQLAADRSAAARWLWLRYRRRPILAMIVR